MKQKLREFKNEQMSAVNSMDDAVGALGCLILFFGIPLAILIGLIMPFIYG